MGGGGRYRLASNRSRRVGSPGLPQGGLVLRTRRRRRSRRPRWVSYGRGGDRAEAPGPRSGSGGGVGLDLRAGGGRPGRGDRRARPQRWGSLPCGRLRWGLHVAFLPRAGRCGAELRFRGARRDIGLRRSPQVRLLSQRGERAPASHAGAATTPHLRPRRLDRLHADEHGRFCIISGPTVTARSRVHFAVPATDWWPESEPSRTSRWLAARR